MHQILRLLAALMIALALSACSQEPTPPEVTQAFWEAVIANDQEKMKQYIATGTLDDPSILDNSEKSIVAVEVGEATEVNNVTRVKTVLVGKPNDKGEPTRLTIDTVMQRENEAWKVNGQETVNNLIATSVNAMMENVSKSFNQIGEQLSKSLAAGVQEFMGEMNKSLPEVQKGLEQLKDEDAMKDLGQSLGQLFSQGLQQMLGDLNKGMEELSKELEAERKRQEQQKAAQEAEKI